MTAPGIPPANSGHRNVLLIVADQLRADALGCYGSIAGTPSLDRLARQGLRFDRHHSVTAPCGPARASLLTGLTLDGHGVRDNRTPLHDRSETVAGPLTEAGVRCHVVGYTDTVSAADGAETVPPGFRWHTRFNLNEAGLQSWCDHLAQHGYAIPDDPMLLLAPEPGSQNRARYPAALSDTAFVADRTIECLRENQDESWLIVSTFLRPHPPYVAPTPYDQWYDPATAPAPHRSLSATSEARRHPFLAHWLNRDTADTDPIALAAATLARSHATYLGLVTELDHHVGRVLAALHGLGRDVDTLVVFTADHGDTLGDHWSSGTGGFRNTAYRVPLIIRAPGLPGATVVRAPTESVDVTATILDWIDARELPGRPGHSLLTRAGHRRTDVRYDFDFRDSIAGRTEVQPGLPPEECRLSVLRGRRFTYVHFPTLPPMLFDHVRDPGEQHDLAGRAEYRRIRLDMTHRLHDRTTT